MKSPAKRPTKESILALYRQCMQESGSAPGQRTFMKLTGLGRADIRYYWPNYSRLVAEAGATPNQPLTQIPEPELFAEYAKVCLHLGRIPSANELRIAARELGSRTHSVPYRFGTIGAFRERFRVWLTSADEAFSEILRFDGWENRSFGSRSVVSATAATVSVQLHPFLPACLQSLWHLAANATPPGEDPTVPAALLFERRCADAFRAIGFEVVPLGQGKGRAADCLALARKERYAVIVDAKARTDGFVLGTEDRKFLEYAKRHFSEVAAQGFERVYFCVVSSEFRAGDVDKLREVLAASPIRGFAMWPVALLQEVVESSIRDRFKFALAGLEDQFFTNGIAA